MGSQMLCETDPHIGHFRQATPYFAGDIVADVPSGRELQGNDDGPGHATSIESGQSILNRWLSQFEITRFDGSDPEPFPQTATHGRQRLIGFTLAGAMAYDENTGFGIKRANHPTVPWFDFCESKLQNDFNSFWEIATVVLLPGHPYPG